MSKSKLTYHPEAIIWRLSRPRAFSSFGLQFCDHNHFLFIYSQGGNQSDLPSSGFLAGTTYAQHHFAQNHELQEQLSKFWAEMREDVDKVGTDPAEFKSQQLPLARIKKVRQRINL
jgi:hypothetical protein